MRLAKHSRIGRARAASSSLPPSNTDSRPRGRSSTPPVTGASHEADRLGGEDPRRPRAPSPAPRWSNRSPSCRGEDKASVRGRAQARPHPRSRKGSPPPSGDRVRSMFPPRECRIRWQNEPPGSACGCTPSRAPLGERDGRPSASPWPRGR